MRDGLRYWRIDLGLRAGGAALGGIAALAIRTLIHLRYPAWPASPGLLAYALAAIGFLGACAGLAMLTLGHHLFDPVETGERWRPRHRTDASPQAMRNIRLSPSSLS